MAARAKHRLPTPLQLAEDELNVDYADGRRHCRVHRFQQMNSLGPGVDRCPLPHEEYEPLR
ncbi:hypothetical protein [Streptomyces chartreusis]|uniref:hypothetical protein n=1 Tax=Streptomyces chartreusis TaxID=1969 RepID=UPI00382BDF1F